MKNKTFKITTKTIAYMAMFMALQVVLELAFKVVPGQPQGGSITLSLVPILLASYLLGGYYGIVVGACCCGLNFRVGYILGAMVIIFRLFNSTSCNWYSIIF